MSWEADPFVSAADVEDLTYALPELDFRMHSHVGITRPIFDIVSLINQIIVSAHSPTGSLIEAIGVKLLQHNPELLSFQYTDKHDETVFRGHANLFFCAALIYFRRYIRGDSTSDVQNQVHVAVEKLRQIEELSAGANNGGWLWPVFVIACEMVKDGNARVIALAWFHRQEPLGLKNITHAKEFVISIWNRRDSADIMDPNIVWFDVIRETNQDLLLV